MNVAEWLEPFPHLSSGVNVVNVLPSAAQSAVADAFIVASDSQMLPAFAKPPSVHDGGGGGGVTARGQHVYVAELLAPAPHASSGENVVMSSFDAPQSASAEASIVASAVQMPFAFPNAPERQVLGGGSTGVGVVGVVVGVGTGVFVRSGPAVSVGSEL